MSIADIKSFLEIDSVDDSILTDVLNGVISFVEQYTGKKLIADKTDVVETYNGDGSQILFLRKYPIVSITKIEQNIGTRTSPIWNVIDPDSYFPDMNKGEIVFPRMHIPRGFSNIQVTYKSGYTDLPKDIDLAIKLLCGKVINRKNTQGIDSESVQGTTLHYSAESMTDEIRQLLDPYRSFYV